MIRWPTVLFSLTLAVRSVQAQRSTDGVVTAFVNVSVLPMDRERVLTAQTVVVRGTQIVALGPVGRVRLPAGAVRIDGAGQFLIPGLVDMHAHLAHYTDDSASALTLLRDRHGLLAYVATGVTTIRNMNGRLWHLMLRDQAARGELLSPRIYSAGPLIEGTMTSVAAAQRIVAEQRAAGYDFIKLHSNSLDPEVFDSFAAAARRAGMPFEGHAPTKGVPLLHLLAAHPRSVEHLYGYTSLDPDSARILPDTVPRAVLRARAEATRRAGVWSCPTLTLLAPAWLMRPELRPTLRSGQDSADFAAYLSRGRRLQQTVRALHDAGAGLLVGTDIPVESWFTTDSGFWYSGDFVAQEIQNLVAAGLSPYAALVAATRSPAQMLGVQDSVGPVAVGHRADLVLLSSNPLTHLEAVRHPAGVMLGGRWLTAAELAAQLAALETQLTALGEHPDRLDFNR